MVRTLTTLAALGLLAACSQPQAADPPQAETSDNAVVSIGAGALGRAYAQDRNDADRQFAGRPVLIDGDVAAVSADRRRITLRTGPDTTIAHLLLSEAPAGLVGKMASLRCKAVMPHGTQVEVYACAITDIADPKG